MQSLDFAARCSDKSDNGCAMEEGETMAENVLSKAVIGHDGLWRKLALVFGGAAFLSAVAQLSVGWPVPMSLQGLAVLIIGFSYGARLAAATLIAYLAYGALGLPVFSNAQSFPALIGPTAGFLYGFVLMAWLAGLAADRGAARHLGAMIAVGLGLSLLLYVPGLGWPAAMLGKTLPELWGGWMAPFLIGDAIKAVLAAMIMWSGWKFLGRSS
ncbi:MAG: biotin transporter BioY [Pseudomonadota bacterium]